MNKCYNSDQQEQAARTLMEETQPGYYYYVEPEVQYGAGAPDALEDLISAYGLESLAKQVARSHADGTKAVKLRKSYKNQIGDLSARFSTVPTRENGKGGELAPMLFAPNESGSPSSDQQLFRGPAMDWEVCMKVLAQFGRSHPAEFNGFSVDDLAFDLDGTGRGTSRKRKAGSKSGSALGTPASEISDDKRRRLE